MSHHITEADNINFIYPDKHQAVKDITFTIHHGESVGLIGANGSGKSTLLMLLIGILTPTSGEVRVGEVKLTKKTMSSIRQRMGMVFQESDDQLFMTSVYDDVAFGPRNFKMDEQEVEKRVISALEQVGIPHLKDRSPCKLSGGEKRAAAIATVLSMYPDILLMDEPTDSLDPKARRRIMTLLKSFEHTKIIASHDLDMIAEICSRIIVLKKGQVVFDGKTSDILTNFSLLEECDLEPPLSMQNCINCGKEKVKKQ